ncbi:hypothetical protein [Pseudomonas frederiksbergensis]|uniref:hypothetical protein n=1 Tax=Pseudomonas frederiksbergensis TaxID=104087 RepID=UPI003D1E5D70
MSDESSRLSLFEEDYLLRELGPVAHVPQVALTELVATLGMREQVWLSCFFHLNWVAP